MKTESQQRMVRRVHVIPTNDKDLHAAQMSCWCFPVHIHGGTVVHNAADCREKTERLDGVGYRDGKWVNVVEHVAPNK